MRCTRILLYRMRTFKIPNCLPNGPLINVSISNCDKDFSQWLKENKIEDGGSPIVLGFDCEWRPNFRPGSIENNVALIQLATANSVFLYHIKHSARGAPLTSLIQVMKSFSITKVGVGVLEDLRKLQSQYNIGYGAYWDLGVASRRTIKPVLPKNGLGFLMTEFYGVELPKPRKVQMSNWEQDPLTPDQLKYAAWDALCGVLLYDHLRLNTTAFEDVGRDVSTVVATAVTPATAEDSISASADHHHRTVPTESNSDSDSNSKTNISPHNYTIEGAIADLLVRGVHWNAEVDQETLLTAKTDTASHVEQPLPDYNATRANFRPALRMAEESHRYVRVLCDFIARESLQDVFALGPSPAQSLLAYVPRLNCAYKINNKAKQQQAVATTGGADGAMEAPGAGQIQLYFITARSVAEVIKHVGAAAALRLWCSPAVSGADSAGSSATAATSPDNNSAAVAVGSIASSTSAAAIQSPERQLDKLIKTYSHSIHGHSNAVVTLVLSNSHLLGWTLAKSKMVGANIVCAQVLTDLFSVQRGIVAAALAAEARVRARAKANTDASTSSSSFSSSSGTDPDSDSFTYGEPNERLVDLARLFAGSRRLSDSYSSVSVGTLPPEFDQYFATRPMYTGAASGANGASGGKQAGRVNAGMFAATTDADGAPLRTAKTKKASSSDAAAKRPNSSGERNSENIASSGSTAAGRGGQGKLWSRLKDDVAGNMKTNINTKTTNSSSSSSNSNKDDVKPPKSTRRCNFYSSARGCRLGSACPFLHQDVSCVDAGAELSAVRLSTGIDHFKPDGANGNANGNIKDSGGVDNSIGAESGGGGGDAEGAGTDTGADLSLAYANHGGGHHHGGGSNHHHHHGRQYRQYSSSSSSALTGGKKKARSRAISLGSCPDVPVSSPSGGRSCHSSRHGGRSNNKKARGDDAL